MVLILYVKSFEISDKKITFSAEEIIPEIILNSFDKIVKNLNNSDVKKLVKSIKNFGEISEGIILYFYDNINIVYTVKIDTILITNILPYYNLHPTRISYDFTALFTGNSLEIYR